MNNEYIKDKLNHRISLLPMYKERLISDAQIFSSLEINSEKDLNNFFQISSHLPIFCSQITSISKENLSKISKILFDYGKKHSLDYFEKKAYFAIYSLDLPIKKIAYPHMDKEFYEYPRNLNKWVDTMRLIYGAMNQGYSFIDSFNYFTSSWDVMEKQDYKSWLSFYQENNHNKYKVAQIIPNFPSDVLKAKIPNMPTREEAQLSRAELENQKKQETEKKIRAIIGRLNSAEKLVTDPHVQITLSKMLGNNLGDWLKSLHELKRMIQTAPWQVLAAFDSLNVETITKEATESLLSDLIIREANILEREGNKAASYLMKKIAQEITPPTPGAPQPSQPQLPTQNPPPANPSDNGKSAIDELIEGMNNFSGSSGDSNDTKDEENIKNASDIVVIAQEVVLNKAPLPTPIPANQPQDIANKEPEDIFEKALSHVTIADVVRRLDRLAGVFRNRQIARELSIIDLMMDKLGIATFFPALAEASSKSLESNQYALTRIEDTLSKLRGSIDVPEKQQIELVGPKEPNPTIEQDPIPNVDPFVVRQNLVNQQAEKEKKDELKRQRREEKETEDLNLKSPPEGVTDVEQELAQPTKVPQAPQVKPPQPSIR